MSTLRPPSTSPSPTPGPASPSPTPNGKSARQSMGPSARVNNPAGLTLQPTSPRPGGISGAGRPTSELLGGGGGGMFQTPEAEAIDQWFENLQNYEATLEEMAAASLDVNFKEELSAIEQWFRVLSEAERTAALYSLLQHSTQVQIRFFITVLQQMARSDPMTALLSPGVGGVGTMQAQMEAKLASMGLKSPGLPASPSARSFAARQSLNIEPSTNFLSPESANTPSGGDGTAAATLVQQRNKLKANAAHRISAPALSNMVPNAWSGSLGQVAERASSPSSDAPLPSPTPAGTNARPKSTDFTGVANQFRNRASAADLEEQLSPMVGGNWASMVNTPLVPMFDQGGSGPQNSLDAATSKLANWKANGGSTTGGNVVLADARKFRRNSKGTGAAQDSSTPNSAVYGDDGNLLPPSANQPGAARSASGGNRNPSGGNNFGAGNQAWNGLGGARSPALSNVSSNRFGSDDGGMSALNGLGVGGFGMNPLASPGMSMGMGGIPGMGMGGLPGMGGMGGFFNVEQLLAAQMAAAGQFGHPNMGFPAGLQAQQNMRGGQRGPGTGGRSPSGKASLSGREGGGKEKDDEIDPKLLDDVPAWLRSLRLHKYTPNFEGMTWKEMVVMDEEQLEAKGVAALGARRKMIKTFEAVRAKMGMDK